MQNKHEDLAIKKRKLSFTDIFTPGLSEDYKTNEKNEAKEDNERKGVIPVANSFSELDEDSYLCIKAGSNFMRPELLENLQYNNESKEGDMEQDIRIIPVDDPSYDEDFELKFELIKKPFGSPDDPENELNSFFYL